MKKVIRLIYTIVVTSLFAVIVLQTESCSQNNSHIDKKDQSTQPARKKVVKNPSYEMERLIEYTPKDYVCGYAKQVPSGEFVFGLFLVKEGRHYNLLYQKNNKTITKRVRSHLAKDLELSIKTSIDSFNTLKDSISHVQIISPDIEWIEWDNEYDVSARSYHMSEEVIYEDICDGCTAYAIIPNKAVKWCVDPYTDILEINWRDELLKLEKSKGTLSSCQ